MSTLSTLSTRASSASHLGDLLVLADAEAQSRVELCARRGAIVTSFSVAGRELLYLEPETLSDPAKNVRGGIPVLFPSPGKLQDDRFVRDGKQGAMKQHGFARTLPWEPSATEASTAEVTLTLRSSDVTRAQFPWDFVLALRFSLVGTQLAVGIRLDNPGPEPLPFAFGFHPYFRVAAKGSARIDTAATRAFDNVGKTETAFRGFNLEGGEVDVHLLDHGGTSSALHLGDGARIDVQGSPELTRWVVWTLPGQPFVCLEPWSAPFDALNTGEGLLHVPPGGVHEGSMTLTFVQ